MDTFGVAKKVQAGGSCPKAIRSDHVVGKQQLSVKGKLFSIFITGRFFCQSRSLNPRCFFLPVSGSAGQTQVCDVTHAPGRGDGGRLGCR